MELHLQVKEARKQAKLSQQELADRADVGRRDISRFERGENITMKTFFKIVGALPNLTELNLGYLRMRTGAPAEPSDGSDVLSRQAIALPSGGANPREQSILRALAQLLVEIADSGETEP